MSYYLFLDDERKPSDVTWASLPNVTWHVCRDYRDFQNCILHYGLPLHISFDHDLGQEHGLPDTKVETGYDCAKWLVIYCLETKNKLPEYTIHSMNPVGKENIFAYLENAKRHINEPE